MAPGWGLAEIPGVLGPVWGSARHRGCPHSETPARAGRRQLGGGGQWAQLPGLLAGEQRPEPHLGLLQQIRQRQPLRGQPGAAPRSREVRAGSWGLRFPSASRGASRSAGSCARGFYVVHLSRPVLLGWIPPGTSGLTARAEGAGLGGPCPREGAGVWAGVPRRTGLVPVPTGASPGAGWTLTAWATACGRWGWCRC